MIKVKVKPGESIDKALKRFKRRFDQTGIKDEIRERQQFEKPSVKKRRTKLKAQYREKMRAEENKKNI